MVTHAVAPHAHTKNVAMPALNTSLISEVSSNSSLGGSEEVLQVVCAWPVSGQYGPGSRVLYYVLIASCLLARKKERLVNAFLAVGLILPAVAALHGIVLAAFHKEGAVDMDIYGAFQLCSIGILAAPVTVMMSRTFFNDPGRNVMFLWTLLVLIGLLCLGVEFYRIRAVDCPFSDSARSHPISTNAADFPYADAINCGLRCSPEDGPRSPMRGGAADNVYVIPAPAVLTFGTTTLLTAACCIHAILCLLSMWIKVVTSWKRNSRNKKINSGGIDPEELDDEGTGATKSMVESINKTIGHYLSMVAIPIFGGAGLAIVIVGELNFFSRQMRYQTETMASVGQWAPIAATALALIGSLYLLVAEDADALNNNSDTSALELPDYNRGRSLPVSAGLERQMTPTTSPQARGTEEQHAARSNAGRRKVATFLNKMGNVLGSPPRGLRQEDMRESRAQLYPVVPGEDQRAAGLAATADTYSAMRSASRAASSREDSVSTPRGSRSLSPRPRAATLPSRNLPQSSTQGRRALNNVVERSRPVRASVRRISAPR